MSNDILLLEHKREPYTATAPKSKRPIKKRGRLTVQFEKRTRILTEKEIDKMLAPIEGNRIKVFFVNLINRIEWFIKDLLQWRLIIELK
jgi:hypothetical protein